MKEFFGKKSRKALTIVFMASLGLHLIGILIFGTIKFVSEIMREETIFQAAPIESPPQMQPEYTVNLQQLNKSTPPPQPQAIVVNNPSELDIPAWKSISILRPVPLSAAPAVVLAAASASCGKCR